MNNRLSAHNEDDQGEATKSYECPESNELKSGSWTSSDSDNWNVRCARTKDSWRCEVLDLKWNRISLSSFNRPTLRSVQKMLTLSDAKFKSLLFRALSVLNLSLKIPFFLENYKRVFSFLNLLKLQLRFELDWVNRN